MTARTAWIAAAALGLGLRLFGLGWGLPQVYEEAYPFKKSWPMWGWGPDARLDLNPHFFNYPTLYFYVQFLGQGLLYLVLRAAGTVESVLDFRVLYEIDKTPFYLFGRGISALFGAATVPLTYALGRRIGGPAVAIPAALLVAVNQTHISKSQVIEVDVPLTLFATLCCLYAVRILGDPRRRNFVLAGICGGLATSTKYSGALLALPIVAAFLVARGGAAAARRGAPRRRARGPEAAPARARVGDLVLAGAAFVLAIVLTSPYVLLDRKTFWIGFNYERAHMRMGHFGLDDSPAIEYYLRVLTGNLLGWPLAILAGAGLLYALIVRRHGWALVLAAWPIVYVALISSWSMKAERYILPLVPLAAVAAAALVADAAQRLRRRALQAAVTSVAALAMAAPSLAAYRRDLARLRADTRTLAHAWIEANVPAGSFLLTEAYGPEVLGVIDIQNIPRDVRETIQRDRQDVRVYALMQLPMYQVRPENSALFYDLGLYDDVADVVVTSSSVGSRYRKDPRLFAAQVAFYDSLEARYTKLAEFGPEAGSGPRIVIYDNPRLDVPFASRPAPRQRTLPAVVPDALPGSIGNFFERYAFNHEAYQFYDAAAAIYAHGLRYRDQPLETQQRSLALGAVRCLVRAQRSGDALALLDAVERAATTAAERGFWQRLRAQLVSRPPETGATPP